MLLARVATALVASDEGVLQQLRCTGALIPVALQHCTDEGSALWRQVPAQHSCHQELGLTIWKHDTAFFAYMPQLAGSNEFDDLVGKHRGF